MRGVSGNSAMPRYYFHLADGHPHRDADGEVLADDAAARRQALAIMHETMEAHEDHILSGGPWTVRAIDDSGREICTLTLQGRF